MHRNDNSKDRNNHEKHEIRVLFAPNGNAQDLHDCSPSWKYSQTIVKWPYERHMWSFVTQNIRYSEWPYKRVYSCLQECKDDYTLIVTYSFEHQGWKCSQHKHKWPYKRHVWLCVRLQARFIVSGQVFHTKEWCTLVYTTYTMVP